MTVEGPGETGKPVHLPSSGDGTGKRVHWNRAGPSGFGRHERVAANANPGGGHVLGLVDFSNRPLRFRQEFRCRRSNHYSMWRTISAPGWGPRLPCGNTWRPEKERNVNEVEWEGGWAGYGGRVLGRRILGLRERISSRGLSV